MLRRENASLRAALRFLAEDKPAGGREAPRALHPPSEASAAARKRVSHASRRRSLGDQDPPHHPQLAVQSSLEGFYWDWPLSRSERKQRLVQADCHVKALDHELLLAELEAQAEKDKEVLTS